MHPTVRRCAVALALALPGLAAGACAAPPPAALRVAGPKAGKAAIAVRPVIHPAAPAAGARRLAATAFEWKPVHVKHVVVTLSELVGGNPQFRASLDVLGTGQDEPVVFGALKANTPYRISTRAYKELGTNAADLISVDATSYVDITTSNEDRPGLADVAVSPAGVTEVPVKLKPSYFRGQVTGWGLEIEPGAYTPGVRGIVSTLAGDGAAGLDNAIGDAARFDMPAGLCEGADGAVYVVEYNTNQIRRIAPNQNVTLFAGDPGGVAGSSDGTGGPAPLDATFKSPEAIIPDADGDGFFVADTGNNTIRWIDNAGGSFSVTTLAGDPGAGGMYTSGTTDAINARFDGPIGLARRGSQLYVADAGNGCIRMIDLAATNDDTSTLGNGAQYQFTFPYGLAFDGGNWLYISDLGARRIFRLDLDNPATVEPVAGDGTQGQRNGAGNQAQFGAPAGLAIVDDILYVADKEYHNIRAIALDEPGFPVSTLAGGSTLGGGGFADGVGSVARFDEPNGLAARADGSLAVADAVGSRIRVVR